MTFRARRPLVSPAAPMAVFRFVSLLLVTALAGTLVACGASSGDDASDGSGLRLEPVDDGTDSSTESTQSGSSDPMPLPDVAFTWWDGTPATTKDLTGSPTVVNFFASWCTPCREELPDFEAASKRFEGSVRFVGIDAGDERESAQKLIDQSGITFEVGEDPENTLFVSLGGFVMPTTYFIDADGQIVNTNLGAMTSEMIDEAIASSFGIEPSGAGA